MIKFAQIQGAEELAAVLRGLPDALAKNALRATGLAGAKVLQDHAYITLSSAVKSGGPRQQNDVVVSQARSQKGEMQVVYRVGPSVNKPWLRWLHDGTKPHTISAVMRHGTRRGALDAQIAPIWLQDGQAVTLRRRGRSVRAVGMRAARVLVLANKAAGKFFGVSIRHPGQPPQPWLLQAQFTSSDAVYRAMAAKLRPALSRQVKRLVSSKYRNRQLRRIFS